MNAEDNGSDRLRIMKLEQIRTDGGTQPRTAINQFVVDDYAEAIISGDEFPPVVVYYDRTIDRRGSMADVLLSSSSDSGGSFGKHFRLSDAASNRKVGPSGSPHVEEADFGTRISVASLSGGAIAA